MSRDVRLYLDDIIASCQKVLRYTDGITSVAGLRADEKTYDAVQRNLLVIGEAVKNVPEEFREQHKQIEWRKIAGLRDFLAHGYFSIDDAIIWDVVVNKIPGLLAATEKLLIDLDS